LRITYFLFVFIMVICFVEKSYAQESEQKTSVSIEKKEIPALKGGEWESAVKYAQKYKKAYKRERAGGYSLTAIGATFMLTGLVSIAATQGGLIIVGSPLMFLGLTLISSGLILHSSAHYKLLTSEEFSKISTLDNHPEIDAYKFYTDSGIKNKVKRSASKKFQTTGIILTSISIPLFIFSAGMFIGLANTIKEREKEEDSNDIGFAMGNALTTIAFMTTGISAIVPAVLMLSGGITLISISSSWKKQGEEPVLTLNNISPMIDPVSKTYGMSAGFSF